MSRRVVFLDIDGVLHPTLIPGKPTAVEPRVSTTLLCWLPALVRVLDPYPEIEVVIHSSWRYTHDLEELQAMLGDLGRRVVGLTPRVPRFDSIRWWLALSPEVESYRILDDDPTEFPNPTPAELILCDPRTGVAAPAVLATLTAWLET